MFAIIGMKDGARVVRSVHWTLENAMRTALVSKGPLAVLRGETFEAGQTVDPKSLRREDVVAVK